MTTDTAMCNDKGWNRKCKRCELLSVLSIRFFFIFVKDKGGIYHYVCLQMRKSAQCHQCPQDSKTVPLSPTW